MANPQHLAEMRAKVWAQLLAFARIVAPAMVVHPVAKWIASLWRFSWRMSLIDAYLIHYNPQQPAIEGTAQRIQEDTQRLERDGYACVTTVLDSVLTLVVFTPVLLEGGAKAHPSGWSWAPWLLTVAASAAVLGLFVSIFVGRELVTLEVQNQKVEAVFRTQLVILEQTPEQVVLARTVGQTDASSTRRSHAPCLSPPSLLATFQTTLSQLADNYLRLFHNFLAFNAWIGVYDQLLVLLPYLLIAPLIFAQAEADRITLGTLMKIVNAFDKVFGALAVVTESWPQINDFRSTLRRLTEFERVLYARKGVDRKALLSDDSAATKSVELECASTRRRTTPVDDDVRDVDHAPVDAPPPTRRVAHV